MNLRILGVSLTFKPDSPDEAIAFVFAALDTEEPEFREYLLARSIVIRNIADADRLRDFPPHLVILLPPATEKAQMLARCSHIVINALGNSTLTLRVDFALTRPYRTSFAKAIMENGMPEKEAEI